MKNNEIKVSFLIPSRNEILDISDTLKCLQNLSYRNYEVILVDCSNDGTYELVRKEFPWVRSFKQVGSFGLNSAYNEAIHLASGEILVLLTADNSTPVDFIERILPHYIQGNDALVIKCTTINIESIFPAYMRANEELKYSKSNYVPLWSEGYSCRKSTAVAAGLFPEGFKIVGGTDNEFARRVASIGKISFDPSIVMPHVQPESINIFYTQMFNRGLASVQLYGLGASDIFLVFYIKRILSALLLYGSILAIVPLIIRSYALSKSMKSLTGNFLKFFGVEAFVRLSVANGIVAGLINRKYK
jgi:glycosyltransferase involved in cell wall biosynthesis